MMVLSGIADSEQLAALTKLLDEYSQELGLVGDLAARNQLAMRIMDLFNNGLTKPEDIRRHLDSSRAASLALLFQNVRLADKRRPVRP